MIVAAVMSAVSDNAISQGVMVGADVLVQERLELLRGKRVGLVANHTALLADGSHLADVLASRPEVHLTALFGPEHGIRGDTTGSVSDGVDRRTGIPVYSLYGKTYRPTAEMLKSVDVILFDIQDVGARFYTYISTLGHVLSAAAEQKIPVIVLDRPNPITGNHVEGPVLDDSLRSFVGYAPIPIRHGMTVGELALLYNSEGWLGSHHEVDLTVVRMRGWTRSMWFDETGRTWVRPSPNMVSLATAVVYPGTCLVEGTNASEGRGTSHPFEYIGAPWLDASAAAAILREARLPGVSIDTIDFTPARSAGNAIAQKFDMQPCQGLYIRVTDRDAYRPVLTGIWVLTALKKAGGSRFEWRADWLDRLVGLTTIRTGIDRGEEPPLIARSWEAGLAGFLALRAKYLLYE